MSKIKKMKLSATIDYSLKPWFGGTHVLTYDDPCPDRDSVTIRFWTPQLANIPWVRALVVAAREMTYRRDIYLDEENDDSLTEVWVYKEDTLERLHAALKPFEGVDYE